MRSISLSVFILAASISGAFLQPPAHAQLVFGADASVWDSAVVNAGTIFPVGGGGQVNGAFILHTVDFGTMDESAIQIGIRAQERFMGVGLTRIGSVFFAATGMTISGGGVVGATWNYDLHLDFGTDDIDTDPTGQSLETTLGRSLDALDMRDFDVEFLLDTDPSGAVDFSVVGPIDVNAFADLLSGGAGVRPDLTLFQTSQNILFGGGDLIFDEDLPAIYDLRLRVSDPMTGEEIAATSMQVVVGDIVGPGDLLDLALTVSESADPAGAPGNLTYTVDVTNNGPAVATHVVVRDDLTLPSGVSVVSTPAVSTGMVVDASPTFTWSLPALAAGQSATMTIDLAIDASAAFGTDVITNMAEVLSADQPDFNPFNQRAGESTSIDCPDGDGDSVCDDVDNCPAVANADQMDFDGDASGDACDLCLGNDASGDGDGDMVCDEIDFCFGNDANGDQDMDGCCLGNDPDDTDALSFCQFFLDGFESGDVLMWSSNVGGP